jgi:1,4-dihydroxy-2-naphthoate polyprenyltransferase
MPVFWFALSFLDNINWPGAILVFFIIHFLIYPSSNGYNSYMDRDTDSIGGLARPQQPTKELFRATIFMDILALLLSLFISWIFAVAALVYITCSRLYSYRGIRLKRFPVTSYATVTLNQGAVVFFMVYHGADSFLSINPPWEGLAASVFLIGGFYPITQIYQHDSDKADGVRTMSMLLGKRGTFIFCAIMYLIAFAILFQYFRSNEKTDYFLVIQAFFLPVILFFFWWLLRVWHNDGTANFRNTMRMNWLAGTCTNLAFICLLLIKHFG